MEQKAASIWKSSLMSGIYLGIAMILVSVIFYVTGSPFSKIAQWLGYVVMIAGIVMAQIGYKKALGGTMTYGQALGVGILTMVFASVLSSIYTFLLYQVIDPSMQEQLRLFTEEQIMKKGTVSEEQMEMAVNMATKFQTPTMMLVMGIFGGAFIGTIVSLITSIFTQKKPTEDLTE
jgi:predicted DNA repair protein MutK